MQKTGPGAGILAAVFLSTMAVGCVTGPPPVYEVHRAALVSPPAPPMWSGRVEKLGFGLGNSTVVWKNPPEQAPQSDSGLYVAATQMDGNFHVNLGEHLALWVPMSYGFSQASFAAAPCLQGRPSEGVFTIGLGIAGSGYVSDRWYLGGSFEGQASIVPSRIRSTCVANCQFARDHVEDQETETVAVWRLSLLAGVDLDPVRIFGGLSFRNHPTNVRIQHEVTYCPSCIDPEVQTGPWYVMPGIGVEVDLGDHVSLLGQIYQPLPLMQHDLIYGPVLGIALDVHAI